MTILRYTIRDPGGNMQVADDTTKPFYVPRAKRHLFCGVNASGYLPAIEVAEQPSDSILIDAIADLEDRVAANTGTLQAQKDQLSKVFQRFSKRDQSF